MNNWRQQIDWATNHYKHHFRQILNTQNIKNQTFQSLKRSQQYLSTTRPYRYTKWGCILALTSRLGYVYGTKFEKQITVTRSFNRIAERNGVPHNEYLIADENHELYKVDTSLWYWQWFQTELWTKFKEGNSYLIKGYGIRIKKFGIHPQIVRGYHIKHSSPSRS